MQMARTGATCPECGHEFNGNGFDGIDAHWRAHHETTMPYKEAWPLIKSSQYKRSGGLKKVPRVQFTDAQREEYERLMAKVFGAKQGRKVL